MARTVPIRPLTPEAFAPFGDVIDTARGPDFAINNGMCDRYHGLGAVDVAQGGPIISIGRGRPYDLPLTLRMVERHPLGSQAFIPLSRDPFLVVVAPDAPDGPGTPLAFLTAPGQGVNYRRNVWHGVLTPLGDVTDFLIVDRGGEGANLEEFFFAQPWTVAPDAASPALPSGARKG